MKPDKLDQLFRQAKNESAPDAPTDFSQQVMRHLRQQPASAPPTMFDLMSEHFPRLAVGALATIALCLALDLVANSSHATDLSEDVAQISSQWLLP